MAKKRGRDITLQTPLQGDLRRDDIAQCHRHRKFSLFCGLPPRQRPRCQKHLCTFTQTLALRGRVECRVRRTVPPIPRTLIATLLPS